MKRIPKTSRDFQAAERREQILQGAKELFAQHGYHGTSIRAMHKHIGITDGLLYHYFPGGKQEILETIVKEAQESRFQQMDELIKGIHPGQPLEVALYQFISGMVTKMLGDRDFLKIMLRDSEQIVSGDKHFMSDMVLQRLKDLTAALARRAAAGEIREMDFEAAARQVISVGLMVVMSQVTAINLVQSDLDGYLRKMVTFTVSLWRK
ncbi:helix-turn-helix domain-containing protein [Paenibacillus oryzisoli]|uniref:TetR/AcrR family transcriptional regulator n=1 Tax=Paenibacillus oryzisoli TaxID=1850517 RepID=UPI003D28B8C0